MYYYCIDNIGCYISLILSFLAVVGVAQLCNKINGKDFQLERTSTQVHFLL